MLSMFVLATVTAGATKKKVMENTTNGSGDKLEGVSPSLPAGQLNYTT